MRFNIWTIILQDLMNTLRCYEVLRVEMVIFDVVTRNFARK